MEEIDIVAQELQALDDHLATLSEEISQLQAKLTDAKAKQKALLLRQQTVENRYKVKRQIHRHNVNEAFTKFEKFERRLDDLEGQVESYDLGKQDLASQIDDLANDDAINAELERLKQEMGAKESTLDADQK